MPFNLIWSFNLSFCFRITLFAWCSIFTNEVSMPALKVRWMQGRGSRNKGGRDKKLVNWTYCSKKALINIQQVSSTHLERLCISVPELLLVFCVGQFFFQICHPSNHICESWTNLQVPRKIEGKKSQLQ